MSEPKRETFRPGEDAIAFAHRTRKPPPEDPEILAQAGFDLLALDPQYDASCPCASFEVAGTKIELHCWRVCFSCEGCGIHYKGDRDVALSMKPALDAMNWYGEWSVREGLRSEADW